MAIVHTDTRLPAAFSICLCNGGQSALAVSQQGIFAHGLKKCVWSLLSVNGAHSSVEGSSTTASHRTRRPGVVVDQLFFACIAEAVVLGVAGKLLKQLKLTKQTTNRSPQIPRDVICSFDHTVTAARDGS